MYRDSFSLLITFINVTLKGGDAMSTAKSQQKLSSRYSSSGGKQSGGKKNNVLWGILVAAVAVIGVVLIVTLSVGGRNSNDSSKSYNLVVTPDNIAELKAANPATVAPGSYDVCMNSTWNFPNAKSASSNAYVENRLSNTNTVNFTVTRKDTGALIFESPYIPVGSSLRNIKLTDESFVKGSYPCVVKYHLLDENYKQISTVSINITVVIEGN